MIFRRLKEALARQDWFAVLLELAIVVVGVMIALAANSWVEARKQQELEFQSLRELKSALELDVASTIVDIGLHSDAAQKLGLLQQHILDDRPYSDTLTAYFGALIQATVWVRNDAAYETLQQRGLETISNDSLRVAIGELYGFHWQNALKTQDSVSEFIHTQMYPFVQRHFDGAGVPNDYESLLRSPEFSFMLVQAAGAQALVTDRLSVAEVEIREVIQLITKELAHS